MGVLEFFRRKKEEIPVQQEERYIKMGGLTFSTGSFVNNKMLTIDAVYAAVNQISNAIARLGIDVYKVDGNKKLKMGGHQLSQMLLISPDGQHSKFNFFKIMVESLLLKGNAYAMIERDEQLNCKSLRYVDSDFVTPMPQPDCTVKYIVSGLPTAVDQSNMIHLYQHLDRTFRGVSVIKHAFESLSGVKAAEEQSASFFKSGQNIGGVINAPSNPNKEQKEQIRSSWQTAFGEGSNRSGVAILPAGFQYQPISINPKDGQLLESRKFNIYTVSRWFNINPVKLFEYSDTNYNGLEYSQIEYMQDTIGPLVDLIKSEFNRKLFKPSQVGKFYVDFDYSVMLHTDKKSEADYYKTMLTSGILSVNEVRDRLGYDPVDNDEIGDKHWMQISYGTMEQIAAGDYTKQTAQSQTQKVDNKVVNKED